MKCYNCEREFRDSDHVYEGDSDKEGNQWCDDCISDEIDSYGSTAYFFMADSNTTPDEYRFTSDFGELPESITNIKWVKSDDWRGYYEPIIAKGFVEVIDGWVTGYPDETTGYKLEAAGLFEKLRDGDIVPPVDIWWVFMPTSNVFSTASSIIIRKGDKGKLNKWLKEVNGGIKGLQNSFN